MSFCSTPGAIGLIVNTASLVIENRLWKPMYGAKKKHSCYPAFVHICLGKNNQSEFLCAPLNACMCLKVIEKLTDESKGTMRSNPGHETLRRGFDHIFQTTV